MSIDTEDRSSSKPAEGPQYTSTGVVRAGVRDILDGMQNWRVWYLMGSAEMRRRFDRSKLGPLWIAISTSVMVVSIGVLWSTLWSAELSSILPFIAIGLVVWQFLSGVILDATMGFPSYAGYFANQYMAPSNVIFALVYKNLITYLINLVVPILVCIVFAAPFGWASLLMLPGLIVQVYVIFCAAYIVAICCSRYRDLIQIVQNLLQIAFFMTPILWKPDLLSENVRAFFLLNPLSSLLAIVRDPMLGQAPSPQVWMVSLGAALVLTLILLPLVGRSHRRIIYWL